MKYKHSLRFRITLSFFLFGTLLMIGVAAGVKFAIEDIESRLVEETLQMEFEDFKKRYHHNSEQALPHSATVSSYLVENTSDSILPEYIKGLSVGMHELDVGEKYMQVIIGAVDNKFLILTRDATLFEQREDSIFTALTASVIAASLLALWLGYGLSQRVIAPVTNLASSVANLSPDKAETLSVTNYADDEVGELAQTFERYLDRLKDFIDREQEFTSNASHELRTPLTVIKGAVELLSADTELPERSHRVLQRIQRATEAMSQMLETLLVLARENGAPGDQHCRLSDIVHEAIAETRPLVGDKPVSMITQINNDFELPVPHSVAAIVLGNLLRNAIAYTTEGEITVTVDDHRLLVMDTGTGIQNEDLPHIFERHFRGQRDVPQGSGIGLAIVKRICDRYGWQVNVASTAGQGACVTINFH